MRRLGPTVEDHGAVSEGRKRLPRFSPVFARGLLASSPLDSEPVRHSSRPILEAQTTPPGFEVTRAIHDSRGNNGAGVRSGPNRCPER
jgi:hypothetical protein